MSALAVGERLNVVNPRDASALSHRASPYANRSGFGTNHRSGSTAKTMIFLATRLNGLVLVAALALVAAGCGLSDYEQRMDAQRARMKLFDEEGRQLDDAIEIPLRKDGDKEVSVWPFDVFLRLPKGYAAAPKEYIANKLVMCRYPGKEGHSILVAAGLLADRNKDNKYKPGEWLAEEFRLNVNGAVQQLFFFRAPPIKAEKLTLQPVSWQADKLPAIIVERETFSDQINEKIKEHSMFRIYHHHQDKHQVAVIYQFPKTQENDAVLATSIDWSIKSLDIGANASGKRVTLASRRKR